MRWLVVVLLIADWCVVDALFAQEKVATPNLKVLTYNIHHGEGTDGKLDLERIAKVIRDSEADLVALQEVDQNVGRSGQVDQPAKLAELAGYPYWAFVASIPLDQGKYGNAVLSKWKFDKTSFVALPIVNVRGAEQRSALLSVVTVPDAGSPLVFIATHFDHRRPHEDRLAAVETIHREMEQIKLDTAILAGDLNCTPDSPPAKQLKKTWSLTSEPELLTFPADKPRSQIDYVAVWATRPAAKWKLISAKVLEEPVASDHRPLLVTYQFQP